MDIFIKLNSEVAGKDKLARLLQYSSRTLWDSLDARKRSNISLINQLKTLENLLSSFRKLLRFGKSLEALQGCLKTIHIEDAWLAFLLTTAKISQTLFLLTDHLIFLARSNLVKNVDIASWNTTSSKYWLISLIAAIARDVYEINRTISSFSTFKSLSACVASSLTSLRSTEDLSKCFSSLVSFACTYKHLSLDLMKNLCDLFIPLNSLGFVKLSPRTIGLLGVISSIVGLIVILNPVTCKLTPQ